MLTRYIQILICLHAFYAPLSIAVLADMPGLTINIEKSIDAQQKASWFVEYKSESEIETLFFNNPSNFSRTERWAPLSDGFIITNDGQNEFVQRKDKKSFTSVRFKLTPTYTHLPKNYAPFSPLSDGGMIFHSGRFFACVELCAEAGAQWQMSVITPKGEHSLVNGKVEVQPVTWIDEKDGRSVYVGKQKPVNSSGVLTIIDQGLPSEITESLNKDIPVMMRFFERKLGKLTSPNTPVLFASYSNAPGSSTQGGTLPDQIFMHWDFDDLEQRVQSDAFLHQTLFYFAHEVAHFFQGQEASATNKEAWIHEGSADYFAMQALAELYPQAKGFIAAKQAESEQHCEKGLQQISLAESASQGKFKLHYSCGLLIHQRIAAELAKQPENLSLSELWQQYRSSVADGKRAGQASFLASVEANTPEGFSEVLNRFIKNKHSDSALAIKKLRQKYFLSFSLKAAGMKK